MERDESGVDITLIDEMIRLTPEQRLRQNDRAVQAAEELRHAFAAKRADNLVDEPRR